MWSEFKHMLSSRGARVAGFRALCAVLVALTLALVAKGVHALVTRVGVPPGLAVQGVAPEPPHVDPVKAKSARLILDRNPFDSVTGPLGKEAPEPPPEAPVAQSLDLSSPLQAPECEKARAYAVTEFEDPRLSVATVQPEGDPRGRTVQVGDDVGDFQVAYIGYNPRERSPAVWLVDDQRLCQALIFSEAKRFASALNKRAAKVAQAERQTKARARSRAKAKKKQRAKSKKRANARRARARRKRR